jgi:hypothetical protein
MKLLSTATALTIALAAAPAFAFRAGPSASPPPPRQMSTTSNQDSRVIQGTVTEYKAGSSLTVRTLANKTETFWLDDKAENVKIDPGVMVGSKVKVTEKVVGGKRTLSVEKTS